MKFAIRFVGNPVSKAEEKTITGVLDVEMDAVQLKRSKADLGDAIIETEQLLEFLLGIRVHIEQVS